MSTIMGLYRNYLCLILLLVFVVFGSLRGQGAIVMESDTVNYSDFDHLDDSKKLSYFHNAARKCRADEFELALKYINWGLKLSKKIDNKIMYGSFWTQKGLLWNSKFEYEKALKAYMTAIAIFEETDDKAGLAYAYLNLGAATNIDTLQLKYYRIAKTNFEHSDDTLGLGRALNNIGVVFLDDFKVMDSAVAYFEKALILFKQIGNLEGVAAIYTNLGEVDLERHRYDSCMEYMQQSLLLFREVENKQGEGHVLFNIGRVQLHMQQFGLCQVFLDSAENIASQIGFEALLADIFKLRAGVFDSLGNYQQAYKWQCKHVEKVGVINKMRGEDKVFAIEKEFEINKKIREIEVLEKEKRTSRIIQIGVGLIFLLIVWIAFIIFRKQREKVEKMKTIQKQSEKIRQTEKALMLAEIKNADIEKKMLEQEIELQSKKISDLASNVVRKIDFIDEMKGQIRNFKGIDNDKNAEEVANTIMISLHQNLELEADQAELKMLVTNNNQKFIRHLELNFPELSKSERQLLGFLKLDIPSKTIASILHISVASVHTKRYRLRKRLQLKNEDSLLDFTNKLPL
jgi:tetratricopeptide (TPR) repeat protein